MSWNFLLGLVFGIEVRGENFGYSIFLPAINSRCSILNSGIFWLESRLIDTVISVLLIIVL